MNFKRTTPKLLICSSALLMFFGLAVPNSYAKSNIHSRAQVITLLHQYPRRKNNLYQQGKKLLDNWYQDFKNDNYDPSDLILRLSKHPYYSHQKEFLQGFTQEFNTKAIKSRTFNKHEQKVFSKSIYQLAKYHNKIAQNGYLDGLCSPDTLLNSQQVHNITFAKGFLTGQKYDLLDADNNPEDNYQEYAEAGGRVPLNQVEKMTNSTKAYSKAEQVLNFEYTHASVGNLKPFERKAFHSLHIPAKNWRIYHQFLIQGIPTTNYVTYASDIKNQYPLHKMIYVKSKDGNKESRFNGVLISRVNDNMHRKAMSISQAYLENKVNQKISSQFHQHYKFTHNRVANSYGSDNTWSQITSRKAPQVNIYYTEP